MNDRNKLENALACLEGKKDTPHPFVAADAAANGEAVHHRDVLDALDVAGIDVADLPTYEDWYLYPTPRGAWQYDSANGIIEQVV